MLGAHLVALALLLAPPTAEGPDEPPDLDAHRTVVPFPIEEDTDGSDLVISRGPSRTRGMWRCVLAITPIRETFFDVMIHQAAGMLGNPVARSHQDAR